MAAADFAFMVLSLSRTRIVLLAVALTAGASAAFPAPPTTREEALTALGSGQTEARLEAIVWFANYGRMTDARLLDERLRDPSGIVRDYAERGLWAIWSRSSDAAIDRLMARGVEEMQAEKYKAAIATFGEVVKKKPDFAEGWNKRATVYFLAGEYQKSIADCGEVLKRNPRHFGALSGLGQIYSALERYDEALGWYRKALDVNPNMLGVEFNMKAIERALAEKRGRTI
jgi:tetratricopeptide (TPR) repeat protein